jgi:hypothetical protein
LLAHREDTVVVATLFASKALTSNLTTYPRATLPETIVLTVPTKVVFEAGTPAKPFPKISPF